MLAKLRQGLLAPRISAGAVSEIPALIERIPKFSSLGVVREVIPTPRRTCNGDERLSYAGEPPFRRMYEELIAPLTVYRDAYVQIPSKAVC
jgi:hypothetical protein